MKHKYPARHGGSMSFEDSILDRASTGNAAQTPIVTIVATIEEDVGHTEGQRIAGTLRREVMAANPTVQNVNADYTVNSFGAETASGITWEDAQDVRSQLRNWIRDSEYTLKGISIMAEIQTANL